MIKILPPYSSTNAGGAGVKLLFQPQLFDKRCVTALIVRLEITEVDTTISNHLEKTASRMKIFWVLLEVLCELVDLLRKESNLNIRRAGVRVMSCNSLDNYCLFLSGKHVMLPYHVLSICTSLG